jgi:hypothetical protein
MLLYPVLLQLLILLHISVQIKFQMNPVISLKPKLQRQQQLFAKGKGKKNVGLHTVC